MTAATSETRTNQSTRETWTIDPSHTSVTFGVRHMMISTVRGEFQKVSGTVTWDPNDPSATVIDAKIDVGSIQTREPQRDAHLKSADFFDVETHPFITFVSRGVTRKRERLEVVGDLTIRGTTRVVALDVEGPTGIYADPWGNARIGASATTKIKRSEFGMTWNTVLEAGGVLVGDEISIHVDVELMRKK
jgi:polyisoprenoid-binding protein YceI